jgi:hypothetical protein
MMDDTEVAGLSNTHIAKLSGGYDNKYCCIGFYFFY